MTLQLAFQPDRIKDETGAGDCYAALFLSQFLKSKKGWEDILQIAEISSCGCSFLLEKKGPKPFASKEVIMERHKSKKFLPSKFSGLKLL